ncbi:MAG: hypothetical protein RL291_774 [Pseudomonadota bacterium]
MVDNSLLRHVRASKKQPSRLLTKRGISGGMADVSHQSLQPQHLELPGARVTLLPALRYAVRYTPERAVIGFAFASQKGWHAFGSDRARPFRTAANGLALTPPGCEVRSESRAGGEYMTIALDAVDAAAVRGRQFTDRIDGAAIRAAYALRRHVLDGARGDGEDAAVAELQVLAACAAASDGAGVARDRVMTASRLDAIDALVDRCLAEPPSVEVLARAIGLSPSYFLRAFRREVGMTPHAYALERRLQHARRDILTSKRSLAAIAADFGFASHAHMTTVFKAKLGVAPSALRGV